MDREQCFCLGYIVRKFSFKGEVLTKLNPEYSKVILNLKSVFIEINMALVPFCIEKSYPHNKGLFRVKFEDIDSEMQAHKLQGKSIFIPFEMAPKKSKNDFHDLKIINFTVEDSKYGIIGKITEISQSEIQPIMIIHNKKGDQVLVPLVEKFIKKIDTDSQTIFIETPEGLIDIYR